MHQFIKEVEKMKNLVYASAQYNNLKEEALRLYGVSPTAQFKPEQAIRARIDYLKQFLKNTGRQGYVLGISGGVDSTTAGRLAQMAVEELRSEGYEAQFVAVRLPAGIQKDEADAQAAMNFIGADKMMTVNVAEAAQSVAAQCMAQMKNYGDELSTFDSSFHTGNAFARTRMLTQYFIGASYNLLVMGTDHSTEGICGFWTKFGDGACDLLVLNGLNKTQVRLTAKALGAPSFLYNKVATADLETERPQISDEEALGFSYDVLDRFLEGETIDAETEYKIISQFYSTQHKRGAIAEFHANASQAQ